MRKKIIIISILLFILLLGWNIYLIIMDSANQSHTSTWSWDITLSDGKVDPQMTHGIFTVEEDGNYNLSLECLPKGSSLKSLEKNSESIPVFVVGCVITDEQERLQYASSGTCFTADTSMELDAGIYNLDYYYFTDREDYVEFAKIYLCGSAMAENLADAIDFPSLSEVEESFAKQDTWTMEYAFAISKSDTHDILNITILFGFLIGFCLVVLIFSLSIKGPELKERYDERQELERGRGFKFAFFTMLFYSIFVFFIDMANISLFTDTMVLYFCGMILGILVYMVYCIWHESYFALNQNMRSVMIFLGLIGVFNLLIGIGNIFNGTMVENGRLTFRIINLLCAFLFIVLFLTILLKKIVSSKEVSAIDEDEEE